jgi:hypothetical protein
MQTEIQSIGPPPEKHADRVVADMLKVIVAARAKILPRIQSVLTNMNDGQPAGQQKIFDRLVEAGRPFFIGGHIDTGKRGRYTITLLTLLGWDSERKTTIELDSDAIPDKPWIAMSVVTIKSLGRRRYDQEEYLSMFITHHALSRLAQRCGARTIYDVHYAVQRIAMTYVQWRSDTKAEHQGKLVDGVRMSVELPNDMGKATCTFCNYNDGDGGAVLVTLWSEEEDNDVQRTGAIPTDPDGVLRVSGVLDQSEAP